MSNVEAGCARPMASARTRGRSMVNFVSATTLMRDAREGMQS
jgi:hypothetical protein